MGAEPSDPREDEPNRPRPAVLAALALIERNLSCMPRSFTVSDVRAR